jgi:hypothetical protein
MQGTFFQELTMDVRVETYGKKLLQKFYRNILILDVKIAIVLRA